MKKKAFIRHIRIIIVTLLLTALITGDISWISVDAKSSNNISGTGYAYEHYENPLYEGLPEQAVEEKVNPVRLSSGTITSYDELVEYIRECMINRNTEVNISYKGSYDGMEAKSFLSKAVNEAFSGKYDYSPTDGDYLFFSYSQYSFSIEYTISSFTSKILFTYHTTAEQEQAVNEKVNELTASWNLKGKSELEIIKFVHDYIVTHVSYDYTYSKYSAYNALIEGTSVCQGYSLLAYRILMELGIDCRIISGLGNGGAHAWNIVKVGSRYYNVDFTWDSTRMNSDKIDYTYFLVSDEAFTGHVRDEKYLTDEFYEEYPMYDMSYYNDTLLNVNAPSYTFKSVGGSNITSDNSKYSVIVMGNMTSSDVKNELKSIADRKVGGNSIVSLSGIRVIAADVNKNTSSTVSGAVSGISSGIIACYDSTSGANQTMFSFAGNSNVLNENGSLTVPLTVIVDKSDKIRYAFTGSGISGERIYYCLVQLGAITATSTATPTAKPTATPTAKPTAIPTAKPTATPTAKPTATPTATPTVTPTATPTVTPTATPTAKPTAKPTATPTATPTAKPTAKPTATSTATPTAKPTATPTAKPTATPTVKPTATPTVEPTATPTAKPTATPTAKPTATPTTKPTATPTSKPTATSTATPTATPTAKPTAETTVLPTIMPSLVPTEEPLAQPTQEPTVQPTQEPTVQPTQEPVVQPTQEPAVQQTQEPVVQPTQAPDEKPLTTKPAVIGNTASPVPTADSQNVEMTDLSVTPAPEQTVKPSIKIYKGKKKVSVVTVKKNKKLVLAVVTVPVNAAVKLARLTAKYKKCINVVYKNKKLTIKGKKVGLITITLQIGDVKKKLKIKIKR